MVGRTFRVSGAIIFWGVVVSMLWVLLLRVVPPPVTWVMAAQSREQGGVERTWKPLSAISPAMPIAVIAAEDQKFFEHFGFDVEAMREAMKYNDRKKGRRIKGASTLSQQTAKNVFCWDARSYVRKGVEAWFTLLIECLWSKDRILEMYLNVAETGKGRFGVEATAQACFKRSAATLSASQAALVAAVLPSPRRFQACRPSGYVQRRQGWVLGQMGQLGDLMDPAFRARIEAEEEKKEERRSRRRAK